MFKIKFISIISLVLLGTSLVAEKYRITLTQEVSELLHSRLTRDPAVCAARKIHFGMTPALKKNVQENWVNTYFVDQILYNESLRDEPNLRELFAEINNIDQIFSKHVPHIQNHIVQPVTIEVTCDSELVNNLENLYFTLEDGNAVLLVAKFEQLNTDIALKKTGYNILQFSKIASIALLVGIAIYYFNDSNESNENQKK